MRSRLVFTDREGAFAASARIRGGVDATLDRVFLTLARSRLPGCWKLRWR
jgi:hypothetical protein